MQHLGKGALRVAKNYTKGYSDVQAKVRETTSNDPWGPSGTQMNELAQMTYNQSDFVEIMEMLDKRLNDRGKNWRHVFKSLTVLDYLLHAGSENCVIYFKDNVYIVKTLREFQYVDEYGKDQGVNVRQKAKDITNLLIDDSRLREERRARASMRDRMMNGREEESGQRDTPPVQNRSRRRDDDADLQKAIEASKRSAAEEQGRQAEERDIAQAIAMSEEEEAKRKKALEDANAGALFDDGQQVNATNPFPLVDPSAQFNQQQIAPQFTAVPQQFTSWNPYAQMAQQEQMQAEYNRMQNEWMLQQQQQQQQDAMQAEYLRQQQLQQQQQQYLQQQQQFLHQQPQQQPVAPQPTGFGSNNPFAPQQQQQQQIPPVPSLSTSTSSTPFTDSMSSSYSSISKPSSPPAPQRVASAPARDDGEHARLASLFANRVDDGMDTFGNVGDLRYGAAQQGRLMATKTGSNPFARQQQPQQQPSGDQPFFSI